MPEFEEQLATAAESAPGRGAGPVAVSRASEKGPSPQG